MLNLRKSKRKRHSCRTKKSKSRESHKIYWRTLLVHGLFFGVVGEALPAGAGHGEVYAGTPYGYDGTAREGTQLRPHPILLVYEIFFFPV